MITAETITDEQIRELRGALIVERKTLDSRTAKYDRLVQLNAAQYQCSVALGDRRARRGWNRAKARARCAEILNARMARAGKGTS